MSLSLENTRGFIALRQYLQSMIDEISIVWDFAVEMGVFER